MIINEENLVQELSNKNEKALDYLVERYGNMILKVAYSVLNDREASLECMNDSLLRIWNNIHCFKGDRCKFTTWVIIITKRIAIDELRKRNKFSNNVPLGEFIASDGVDIEKKLEHKEFKQQVLKAINNMEQVSREVFLRRFFMDESIKNIAEEMGISVSAVSNRILRGKKKLDFLFGEEVI